MLPSLCERANSGYRRICFARATGFGFVKSGTFGKIWKAVPTVAGLRTRFGKIARGRRTDRADKLRRGIVLVYQNCLGRDPDEDTIASWMARLADGLSFTDCLLAVDSSEEAVSRRRRVESLQTVENLRSLIAFVYENALGRPPCEHEYEQRLASFEAGWSLLDLLVEVRTSPEADRHRLEWSLGPDLSDGQFILMTAPLLFGRGIVPEELEIWKHYLNENAHKRHQFAAYYINAHIEKQRRQTPEPGQDPDRCTIMGTTRFLTRAEWEERAKQLGLDRPRLKSMRKPPPRSGFEHSGDYIVSAIASLYKGGCYIDRFLDNITSQTIFHRSELIIIDANSPEGEEQVIREYQRIFPNIVYQRINYRIGIYDAWNIGVEIARGRYLTNTNLDDLRRRDSFEIQAATLDRHAFADMVYQDFFYSFDASFSFDDVAALGFKSRLPIVTPHNLLRQNSPHNAPMWRKRLHEEVGYFDTSFESAGDYEFWLRCLSQRKKFFKVNEPHVVYFQNAEGVSTKRDTKGLEEAYRIFTKYSNSLISPRLALSRAAFAAVVGIDPRLIVGRSDVSYYDVIQDELRRLGERHKAGELRDRAPNIRDCKFALEVSGNETSQSAFKAVQSP